MALLLLLVIRGLSSCCMLSLQSFNSVAVVELLTADIAANIFLIIDNNL